MNNHPVYNDNQGQGWLELEAMENTLDSDIIEVIKRDKDRMMQQAIGLLNGFLDKTKTEFRLDPELFDCLIKMMDNDRKGFQVYFEFTFTAHLTKNRPESDSWWVIVGNSDPFYWMSLEEQIPYNCYSMGWYCQ